MAAKSLDIPSVNCKIKDLTDKDITGGLSNTPNHSDDGGILSSEFLSGTELTVHWDNPASAEDSAALQKKLRKGDLVGYPGHVSTIYSDKPACNNSSCSYELIHAFSWECSNPNRRTCRLYPWFRKVGVTFNDHPGLPTPKGFGRIKLWD